MISVNLRGFVDTDIKSTSARAGIAATASFRMGAYEATDPGMTGPIQWFMVNMRGDLATNAAASLRKGQRVLVSGRFLHRQWVNLEQRRDYSELALDALTVGHDLAYGISVFAEQAD